MLCRGPPRGVRAMTRPDFPRTLAEFQGRFASEEDCRRYLVACRWPDGFRCPRCGEPDAYGLAGRELLQCRACRHQTSVTAGTVLHRTHVPLRLWFAAAYLVTTPTPGFSAVQLQRQLGLARDETAWTMLHELRRAMVRPERDRLPGVVEVDEAYVGGVEEGRRGGRRRDSGEPIVVGAVEGRGRGSGRGRLAGVEGLSAASLGAVVGGSGDPGSTVLNDGWQGHAPLRKGLCAFPKFPEVGCNITARVRAQLGTTRFDLYKRSTSGSDQLRVIQAFGHEPAKVEVTSPALEHQPCRSCVLI